MGGCNPCAAQYDQDKFNNHPAKQNENLQGYNQYWGSRPLDIYKKGNYLLETESNDASESSISDQDSQEIEFDPETLKLNEFDGPKFKNVKNSKKEYLKGQIREQIEQQYFKYPKQKSKNEKQEGENEAFEKFMDRFLNAIYDDIGKTTTNLRKKSGEILQEVALNKLFQHKSAYISRNFIKVVTQYDEETFEDKEPKPWEKIAHYIKLLKPNFNPSNKNHSEIDFEEHEEVILSKFLLVAILCKDLEGMEAKLERYKKLIYIRTSEIMKDLYNQEEMRQLDMKMFIIHARLRVLKNLNYDYWDASHVIKTHNDLKYLIDHYEQQKKDKGEDGVDSYYRKTEFIRDQRLYQQQKEIIRNMIKAYGELTEKDDGVTEGEENEMLILSKVNDHDLFRLVLEAVYTDVEDNPLKIQFDFTHKVRILAYVLREGSSRQSDENDGDNFLIPEDVNMCCNLVRVRIDKLASFSLDESFGASQMHKSLDSLNEILIIMQQKLFKGFSEESYQLLRITLQFYLGSFKDRAMDVVNTYLEEYQMKLNQQNMDKRNLFERIIANLTEAESLDQQIDMTHKLGYTCQALFAMQAVDRIRTAFTTNFRQGADFYQGGYAGTMTILSGIKNVDFDEIQMGSEQLGQFAFAQYQKGPQDWFDLIVLMKNLSENHFEQFAHIFFSGEPCDYRNKMRNHKNPESEMVVTYYMIKCLDDVIRNRQLSHDVRMQSITYLKYVYENKNLENKQPLEFIIFPNMKFFIRERLTDLQKLKAQKLERLEEYRSNDESDFAKQSDRCQEIRLYAREVLRSMHLQSKEAEKYCTSLIAELAPDQLGTSQKFYFTDFLIIPGTVLFRNTLQKRMKEVNLRSKMLKRSEEFVDDHKSKGSIEVEFKGQRYLDNKEDGDEQISIIEKAVPEFIQSDLRTMIISALPNQGSTHLMRRIEQEAWNDYYKARHFYIPIFIQVPKLKKIHKCIEEYVDSFNAPEAKEDEKFNKELLIESSKQNKDINYLIILDEYDALGQAKNILQINKFYEWPRAKFIISAFQHQSFEETTMKFVDDQRPCLRYRIVNLSNEQITKYIEKVIKNKEHKKVDDKDAKEKSELQFNKVEDYTNQIEALKLWEEVRMIGTLVKVIKVLPELVRSETNINDILRMVLTNQDAGQLTSSFQIFEKTNVEGLNNSAKTIYEENYSKIPPGYDLKQSILNYYFSLALDMWLYQKRTIRVKKNVFPFPKPVYGQDQNQYFMKYFSEEPTFILVKSGAHDVSEQDGEVFFQQEMVKNHYVAKALYTYISKYDENKQNFPLEKSYLNGQLLVDDTLNSEIYTYLLGRILKDMSDFDDIHKRESTIVQDFFTRTDKLATEVNIVQLDQNRCKVEKSLLSILKKIKIENVNLKCMQNILIICSGVTSLIEQVPEDVAEYILSDEPENESDSEEKPKKSKLLNNLQLKSRIVWGKALNAKQNNDEKKCKQLQLKALGYELGGIYDGQTTLNEQSIIKIQAHGEGHIKYADESVYFGEFKHGKRHGKGEHIYSEVASQNDNILTQKLKYKGDFVEDMFHGEGILQYHCGNEYRGQFRKDLKHGKGSFTYAALEVEYHGAWKCDLQHGEGVLVSRQSENQFLIKADFGNNMFHGDVTIIIGENSNYRNLMFKGKYRHGVCLGGQMFTSFSKSQAMRLTLGKDMKFKFLPESECIKEYEKSIVYFKLTKDSNLQDEMTVGKLYDDRINRQDFDDLLEASHFYKMCQKGLQANQFLESKILVTQGKCRYSSDPENKTNSCIEKAMLDGVIGKKLNTQLLKPMIIVSEFSTNLWEENEKLVQPYKMNSDHEAYEVASQLKKDVRKIMKQKNQENQLET